MTLKAGIIQMPIVDGKRKSDSVCILTKQFCAEFYYSHGLFRNENSIKGSNLTSDEFLPGIFIWCYIQVKLAILSDNDDGILWENYFAQNATIFPSFFQEIKFDQRYQHDLCQISSRVNWRCFIWIKSANLIEQNHFDIESWYNSNADSRWKTQKWFRLYFDKTILCRILLVSHGLFRYENSMKGSNLTSDDFFPGIFIWCYIQAKLANLIDNDDGILWPNYFAKNATIFPWFFQERKFDQRQQHDPCKISSRLNWKCYIWIKSANLIEHNHCDIESWYNSNADSRWKTKKWFRLHFDKTILCRFLLFSHGLFRNENSIKGSNLTSDEFFAGNIHLMLHSGQVGNLNR